MTEIFFIYFHRIWNIIVIHRNFLDSLEKSFGLLKNNLQVYVIFSQKHFKRSKLRWAYVGGTLISNKESQGNRDVTQIFLIFFKYFSMELGNMIFRPEERGYYHSYPYSLQFTYITVVEWLARWPSMLFQKWTYSFLKNKLLLLTFCQ